MFPAPTEPGDDDGTANAPDEAKQVFPPKFHALSTDSTAHTEGGQPTRYKINQPVHNPGFTL